jgi:SAM-dependent methyltransferase
MQTSFVSGERRVLVSDDDLRAAPEVMAKNGYALLTDLEDAGVRRILQRMEAHQVAFLEQTHDLWRPGFPIPGDTLAHFSRQWELPYAWTNLAGPRGRILDAGSGITFFPFLLASEGAEVDCCDRDSDGLGLADLFQAAVAQTAASVRFVEAELTDPPYPAGSFDAVICISVLEHAGPSRLEIVRALARLLRPAGRLVMTCDVNLGGGGEMPLEEIALVLGEVERFFEPVYPLDLSRPPTLLTSDRYLSSGRWRLPWPWRPPERASVRFGSEPTRSEEFQSIAILGLTATRRL